MIFAVTTAINQFENFKYRIQDDKVVLHDKIHPLFIDGFHIGKYIDTLQMYIDKLK